MRRVPSGAAGRINRSSTITAAGSLILVSNKGTAVASANEGQLRAYHSPIGGPAPYGKPMKSAPISDVNAAMDTMFTHHKRMRAPKKKILSSLGDGEEIGPREGEVPQNNQKIRNQKREPTKEEKRRAQLLGPFAKFIKLKAAAEANAEMPDGQSSYAAPPALSSAGSFSEQIQQNGNNVGFSIQPDHLTAPIGHDATPLSRGDRRFFVSAFEHTGVYPVDAHKIRDETNYDHPAYKQPFEVRRGTEEATSGAMSGRSKGVHVETKEEVEAVESDVEFIKSTLNGHRPPKPSRSNLSSDEDASIVDGSAHALFHKLRGMAAHRVDDSSAKMPSMGSSQVFQGMDPLVQAADKNSNDLVAAGDDDDGAALTGGPADDGLRRNPFIAGSTLPASATEGTRTYLTSVQGYKDKDLVYSPPLTGSLPSTFEHGGRDGQLNPERLIDIAIRKAEDEAIAARGGVEEARLARLKGEREGDNTTSIFIPESFVYKPFSDTNEKDRWVPSSEVLKQHEIAKTVSHATAAYIHHTAADVVARDLRAVGGEDLVKDESQHSKAQGTAITAPKATVFASDLDAVERRYVDAVRAARQFPELPPALIRGERKGLHEVFERVDSSGQTVRHVRPLGDDGVNREAARVVVNPDGSISTGSPRPVGANGEQPASLNPHFPESEENGNNHHASRTSAPSTYYSRVPAAPPRYDAELTAEEFEAAEEAMAAVSHPHAGPSDAREAEANEPLDPNFFSRLTIEHGKREMAPEDVERRMHVRPRVPARESPGVLGYKPPTLRDAEDTRINRFSLEEWWGDKAHIVNDIEKYRALLDEESREEYLQGEGVMDAIRVNKVSQVATAAARRYTHEFPKNELIQDEYVVISKIIPTDGTQATVIPVEHRMKMRVGEARRIAKGMGLDLIKVNALGQHSISSYAQCIIADHRYDKRDYIAHTMRARGVVAPVPKECREMGFRAATKPHDIWHKSFRIARMMLQGFPVRIFMKDIGAPREGVTAFQGVLEGIKAESLKIKAFHTAGTVRMSDDLIECILYPSTLRHPKSDVIHPTPEMLRRVRDHRILEHEKEVYRDNVLETSTRGKEGGVYMRKIAMGTAWTHNDEGLSLHKQREVKKILGWLPKGNKALYAARGDVNINSPFRAGNATSVERLSYPRSTNLEQATRGIMALAARAEMDISEMHDRGETEENEHTLQRYYYRVEGDALQIGAQKEKWGMKTNRRKLPQVASGFATLGVEEDTELRAKQDIHFHGSS